MSLPSTLSAALYVAENTFGEDATPTIRMPIIDPVDLSGLLQNKLPTNRAVQHLNDGTPEVDGPQGGTFRTRFYLTGHGSTTSGATALTSLATMLGYVFGGAVASAASGTTTTGGTAAAPTTTASATFTAGSLCRIGAGGGSPDGRGSGQFAAITSHVTTTLNLLTALGAAPNNGDVLYSAENVYTLELPSSLAAVTGLSWRLLTGNLQIDAHGCYASSVTITAPINGELPVIEIEWTCARWEFVSETFPTATTGEEFSPAPAGPTGSVFVQTKGTATRATRVITGLTINVSTGIVPVMAPGGGAYQTVVAARRTPMEISVEWEEEAPAASATPASDTDFGQEKHLLYTLNSFTGRAVGIYFPRLVPTAARPTQNQNNNLNRQMRRYLARTGDTRTTDLTASAIRLAFA